MSSAVTPKPLTTTQRAAAAVQQAAEELGLVDVKRLSLALTIAAAESLRGRDALAERVRSVYDDLAPRRATTRGGRKKSLAAEDDLIPVKVAEGHYIDPAAPPDPYFLLDLYGPEQLARALGRYTTPRLRLAVKAVQARHPGIKPGGTDKQALIDYIVTILLPLQL